MNPYRRAFLALMSRRPRAAIKIAWWWTTRRRLRAIGQLRHAIVALPNNYRLWLMIRQPATRWTNPAAGAATAWPGLAIHLHVMAGQPFAEAIRSVAEQSYPHWELHVTSDGQEYPAALVSAIKAQDDPRIRMSSTAAPDRSSGIAHVLCNTAASHLVPLAGDCLLAPGALHAYARAIRDSGAHTVFFSDQDERTSDGSRAHPWLKPEWDEDLFLAQDYMSAACAIPVARARGAVVGGTDDDGIAIYGLLTRLLLGPDAVPARHVPYVSVTTPANLWCTASTARLQLIERITGLPVTNGPFGTLILHHRLPLPLPRVSVIVPTRDRLDLLRPCVEGVLNDTDYPELELVIVDNGSIDPETLAFLADCRRDPRVRVLYWPNAYNYSAINNFAVRYATGDYLCLLNNDTEIVTPSWLRNMMAHAVRPKTGAVGAKLLYPDRTIQHAGVVVGMGNAAGHAHRGLDQDEPGWFAQTSVTRIATAVTAACLVVARSKFDAVGGLDERALAIAYNDVDFCLKLRQAGWNNIFAAQAVLIHHESKSRGLDLAPENLARYHRELTVFQDRWQTPGFADPTHPPGLDPASELYRLGL